MNPDRQNLRAFARAMPKAELHIHIEGSLEPELIFSLNQPLLRNFGANFAYLLVDIASITSEAARWTYRAQLANFTNPAGLESRGMNLYFETAASGTPNANTPGTNGLGLLQQGYLETSNVNVVEELVSMIQTQRAYEINSKAIQTSDQMLARLAQL